MFELLYLPKPTFCEKCDIFNTHKGLPSKSVSNADFAYVFSILLVHLYRNLLPTISTEP